MSNDNLESTQGSTPAAGGELRAVRFLDLQVEKKLENLDQRLQSVERWRRNHTNEDALRKDRKKVVMVRIVTALTVLGLAALLQFLSSIMASGFRDWIDRTIS